MEPIVESTVTKIDLSGETPKVEKEIMRIFNTKPVKRFYCNACEVTFETNKWKKHGVFGYYMINCPCCGTFITRE